MERCDDLQLKGLKIIQDTDLFCFGTDAVLLADFAEIKKGDSVVDLGTAAGILPLLLYGRQELAAYHAVEIQSGLCALAQRNVQLNGLDGVVDVRPGDIRDAPGMFGHANDVVVCNPPYEKADDGAARRTESHRIARKEVLVNFADVCAAAEGLLRQGGRFYVIHKASRMAGVIHTLKEHRLEPKTLRLVHGKAADEPRYVLAHAVKGAKESLRVLPPLVLYDADGGETREMKRIYNK
jgi:tRNA1Val (adenine37-N6)-methyltransferase